nr:serine protease [Polyrhizophydium stewartii]
MEDFDVDDGLLAQGDLNDDVAVQPPVSNSPRWENTLNKIIPAIVSVRLICVRNFDTEAQKTSQATGFVVDKERGPILADAIFNQSKEEVRLIPIYRDPVHDFGFFKFDTSAIKHMKLQEIPLCPELARVGLDIRVVGNDSGERLSILSGTLARLDRKAPNYGAGRFNDWNTFYYQAASMTSGGSSGSPVIDVDGNAIALNAGGATASATSFFLPLDRVVRVLKLIQADEPVTRGTIQTVFQYTAYDEVKRLGLLSDVELEIRQLFPENTGMLTVRWAGTALYDERETSVKQAGDIVFKINGEYTTSFVPMEHIFDTNVNIGGGILHDLSYQMARSYIVPTGGVFVAGSGYMLGLSGIARRCIIERINNTPTPTLDDFIAVMSTLRDHQRVPIRFYQLSDINRPRTSIVLVDRRPAKVVIPSLVNVAFYLPFKIDGVTVQTHTGVGVILDAEQGLLLVDRQTVPTSIGDILLTFANSIIIPARAIFIHQIFNFGIVKYDPSLLGDTFVKSIDISQKDLSQGDSVYLVCLSKSYQPLVRKTVVTNIRQFFVNEATPPSYRAFNVEGIEVCPRFKLCFRAALVRGTNDASLCVQLENPLAYGGVLTTEDGQVQGFFASHTKHGSKTSSEFHMGMPIKIIAPVLERLRKNIDLSTMKTLEVELTYTQIAHARIMGLTDEWVKKIESSHLSRRNVLVVRRVTSGTPAGTLLKASDIIIAVNGVAATQFSAITDRVDDDSLKLHGGCEKTVLRDARELNIVVPLSTMQTSGTERLVGWSGAIFQMPHKAVYQQLKEVPPGVLCTVVYDGSPSQLYGLHPLTWVTEVNGVPIQNLDDFLDAVSQVPADTFVRLRTVTSLRFVKVIALRPNPHYFGLWQIQRDESKPSTWSLRAFTRESS